MLVRIDIIQGVDMPTLELATAIHPAVGILTAIALLGMMYNTAVGMFYSFAARFFTPDTKTFKIAVVIIGAVGFFASLFGFTNLVS